MKNSKKLLSLFLAVVMIFSMISVVASAYTVGPDIADGVNYKYTVEKVDTVPETAAGSEEWTADNIYAVSVWMKASMGVDALTAPIHFDKTLFSPIMLSDGEVTYPHGAGFGVDDYYENMGEGVLYAYAEGDYLLNTGMYKADGSTATSKALAKCIGLGNENSAGVTITAELVSPDHPLYSKWGAGLPANAGVMYVNLDVAGSAKSAYLNTIEGINYSTDWNKMFTVYFETITDADVSGAKFGVFTDDCFTVDANFDATGAGYFVGTSSYQALRPATNVVSNAVIESSAPACTHENTTSTDSNVVAANCTTAGSKTVTVTCNDCGEVVSTTDNVVIPALGHDMQKTADAIDPDCKNPGKTAVYTCANGCGTVTGGDPVDALGHKYDSDVTAPTCTEEGYTTYTCSVCGDSYEADRVDATGHVDLTTTTVEATYTKPGSVTVTCACGEVISVEEIAVKTLVKNLGTQIKFNKDAGTYDIRVIAGMKKADFLAAFGSEENAVNMIKSAGFVFGKGSAGVTAEDALAVAKAYVEEGTAVPAGYETSETTTFYTGIKAGYYAFTTIVAGIPNETDDHLYAVGYIVWEDANGETCYAFYPATKDVDLLDMYNRYYK